MSTSNQSLRDRLSSLIAATKIVPPNELALESELYNTKWFAYRFMNPVEATMLFGSLYIEQRQAYIRRNIDREASERAKPFRFAAGLPSRPSHLLTKLWKARQVADRFTIPYEMYLTFCFRFAEARTRRCAPQPEQLKPTADSERAWHIEFEKFFKAEFDHWVDRAELPDALRIEAFNHHPAQIAFREFVVGHVRLHPTAWHVSLGRWSVQKRVVPLRAFVTPSNREVIRAAIPRLRADLKSGLLTRQGTRANLSADELYPVCFSVPFASGAAGECAACPFGLVCQRGATAVATRAGVNLLAHDPDGDRRRRLTRERVKKHRESKKLAGTLEGLIRATAKRHASKRRTSPGTM